jgi:hypothetical protein
MNKLNVITYIIIVSILDIDTCQTPNSSSIRNGGATKILRDIENFSLNGSTKQPLCRGSELVQVKLKIKLNANSDMI